MLVMFPINKTVRRSDFSRMPNRFFVGEYRRNFKEICFTRSRDVFVIRDACNLHLNPFMDFELE